MKAAAASATGFTLVEVLVAISLLALIAALGAKSLRSMAEASSRVETRLKEFTRLQVALGDLERDLSLALPVAIRVAGQGELPGLLGDDQQFEFSRQRPYEPPERPGAGLTRVRYRIGDGALWREDFAMGDRWPEDRPRRVRLLTGVRSGHFRYLGNGRNWSPAWPLGLPGSEASVPLPRALAVELVLEVHGRVGRLFRLALP